VNDLVSCSSCRRHVRRSEERCPFCGTQLDAAARRALPPVAPLGLSRAKLYAFHAAVATGVAAGACGGATSTPGDAGGSLDATSSDGTSNDGTASDGMATDGQNAGDATDTGTQDASADTSTTAEAGADQAVKDAGTDGDGWGPPPPPYGCVFPEGCGDVKV
jgi:hypothetical protein